jgi:hypothetical protein
MTNEIPSSAENLVQSATQTAPESGPSKPKVKKSWYQRYVDAKRGRNAQISDADLKKFTGKTRDELNAWAKDRPGVAGNQAAGTLAMGPASGLGGLGAAEGLGGWGYSAGADPKFPPKAPQGKKEVDRESGDGGK